MSSTPRWVALVLPWLLAGGAALATQDARPTGERLDQLIAEYREAMADFHRRVSSAASEEEQLALFATEDPARIFAAKVWELVTPDPATGAGLRGLLWIVDKGIPKDADRALGLLAQHHHRSAALDPVIARVATTPALHGPRLLEAILEDHPDRALRGRACLALGRSQLEEVDFQERLADLETRKQVIAWFGQGLVDHILAVDPAEARRSAEEILERAVSDYGDVAALPDGTVGERARQCLLEIRRLRPGSAAPEIVGEDLDGVVFRLSDYRGKVVMLDFWGHW